MLCLEYLHDKKIIYRDIKPENIMVDMQVYISRTILEKILIKVITNIIY